MQNLSIFSKVSQQRQHRFILNMKRDDDQNLDIIIKQLKARRSFTRAIRIGLLLFWSLMNGQTDILLQEFPWVADRLQNPTLKLQEQLNRIEEHLLTVQLEPTKTMQELKGGEPYLNEGAYGERPERARLSEAELLEKMEVQQKPSSGGVEKEYYGWVLNWKLWLTQEDNNLDRCLLKFGQTALEWGIKVGALPANALARQAELLSAQETEKPVVSLKGPIAGSAKVLANAPEELPPPEELDLDLL